MQLSKRFTKQFRVQKASEKFVCLSCFWRSFPGSLFYKKLYLKNLKYTLKRLTYRYIISIINLFTKNKLEVYYVRL